MKLNRHKHWFLQRCDHCHSCPKNVLNWMRQIDKQTNLSNFRNLFNPSWFILFSIKQTDIKCFTQKVAYFVNMIFYSTHLFPNIFHQNIEIDQNLKGLWGNKLLSNFAFLTVEQKNSLTPRIKDGNLY